MKKHTINSMPESKQPAYVANGFIGFRVGICPFIGQTGLLAGFTGSHERFGVEAYAPIPVVSINLSIDGSSLWQNMEGYRLIEQLYDFSCGELNTRFEFVNPRGQKVFGNHLIYCSRSHPSVVVQEVEIEVDQACDVHLFSLVEPTKLPIHTRMTIIPNADCDGVLWLESRDKSTGAGMATYLSYEFDGAQEISTDWGYEQERLVKTYSVQAYPGKTYVYKMMTSYIPGTLHSEPHWQAVRMIKLAQWKGFAKLREENRNAWEKLWESRVRVIGASEEWQDVIDASFFYLYSSIHPSSPQSMAPFGLSQRDHYKGHVFWDTESFMFTLPLLTDPAAARAILEYRFQRLPAARHNAMINGYNGIQFPWQSGMTGDEVTRVSAGGAAGAGEQHVNLDVAMAFIAHYQISGDEIFLRERAWPVVNGVAEWIESRVEKTDRGYEILFVTGIDEGADNVNNDSFTNALCKLVLSQAIKVRKKMGYPRNILWEEIAETLFIPVHEELQYVEQYEGCKIQPTMEPVSLMAFFPYGYSYNQKIDQNTFQFFIDHDLRNNLTYPMLSGFLGVIPCLVNDRQLAKEFFELGNLDFFIEPYCMCTEGALSAKHYQKHPDAISTIFITGRGSLMTGLLMGLTRLNIWKDEISDWFEGPIVMPEGWDGIVLGKVYIHGRPARITAMHGMPKAQLEWLDQ